MSGRIVVGADGSEPSRRAVAWCAAHAAGLDAEVTVVHAFEVPRYTGIGPPEIWVSGPTSEQRAIRRDLIEREWCKPLTDAAVPFRIETFDGEAAPALLHAARDEDVMLVVVGRRGHHALAELILGSTTHHVSHHADRPVLIIP
jgi:nucleotide-binding universal stress UspA family protein